MAVGRLGGLEDGIYFELDETLDTIVFGRFAGQKARQSVGADRDLKKLLSVKML